MLSPNLDGSWLAALTALYAGDANNATSTSAAVRQTVSKIPTITALASSGTPSFVGQPVTFTATVTPAIGTVPDGEMVTFRNGGTALGTAVASGGVAVFTTSALAVGSRSITAVFAGDSNLATSTSLAFTQVVSKYSSSTSVTSSLNPSAYGTDGHIHGKRCLHWPSADRNHHIQVWSNDPGYPNTKWGNSLLYHLGAHLRSEVHYCGVQRGH